MKQRLQQAKAGQKGRAMKWVTPIVVVLVCGVGAYFGYGYFKQWQAKRSEAAKAIRRHRDPGGG